MRRAITALTLILTGGAAAAQAPADLSPLAFLVGDWQAVDTAPGETGRSVFALQVQDRVMVRTNEAVYPATADRPASRHDDLMVIYREDAAIKADYFDNEGHVIRYVVQPAGGRRAVFVSDPSAREPRYRLTYSLGANGVLEGAFEIAPPGSPDAFKAYLTWKAKKNK